MGSRDGRAGGWWGGGEVVIGRRVNNKISLTCGAVPKETGTQVSWVEKEPVSNVGI